MSAHGSEGKRNVVGQWEARLCQACLNHKQGRFGIRASVLVRHRKDQIYRKPAGTACTKSRGFSMSPSPRPQGEIQLQYAVPQELSKLPLPNTKRAYTIQMTHAPLSIPQLYRLYNRIYTP